MCCGLLLFVAVRCFLLFVVCCLLRVVDCRLMLSGDTCRVLLVVDGRLLALVWWCRFGVCCLLIRYLFVVWFFLRVVRCSLFVARYVLLFVVCCLLSVD